MLNDWENTAHKKARNCGLAAMLVCALLACAVPAPKPAILFLAGSVARGPRPASRVYDAPAWAESFVRLRVELLERTLGLAVSEQVLDRNSRLDPAALSGFRAIVLGSNSDRLHPDDISALSRFVVAGGRVLVYADWQYGDDNWQSDNDFLQPLGISVLPDNFQPRTRITPHINTHPLSANVASIEVEGISQFVISPDARRAGAQVLAQCAPQPRPGCAIAADQRIASDAVVACVWTMPLGAGEVIGVCDRNPFHDGPQQDGTDLDQADNRRFATNLFRWLAR